jgi:hypothetical protein
MTSAGSPSTAASTCDGSGRAARAHRGQPGRRVASRAIPLVRLAIEVHSGRFHSILTGQTSVQRGTVRSKFRSQCQAGTILPGKSGCPVRNTLPSCAPASARSLRDQDTPENACLAAHVFAIVPALSIYRLDAARSGEPALPQDPLPADGLTGSNRSGRSLQGKRR